MPDPRQLHRQSIRTLSIVMIVLGVALIARTVARGGGGLAIGVVLGVLFVAAGAARLLLASRRP
jgi:hypothetical protein